MRIEIVSDIHANYEALSACLALLRDAPVDEIYCLGDTVGYGGAPNACADVIRQLAKVTILGNHDAAVEGRMDYSYYYEAARVALDTHVSLLTPENMRWLQSLPYTHLLEEIGVQREEQGRKGRDVPEHAGAARADFLERPSADGLQVLLPVQRELVGCRGRVGERHPELPPVRGGLTLERQVARDQHERKLVRSRLRETGCDGHPLLGRVRHLC